MNKIIKIIPLVFMFSVSPNVDAIANTNVEISIFTNTTSKLKLQDWSKEYAKVSTKSNLAVDIVKDYGAMPDGKSNSSKALQKAIDDVSNKGGGVVFIPKGEYRFLNIIMRSNVKLYIDHRATISPYYNTKEKLSLFNFGDTGENIENVEVCGVGGRFNIVLEKQKSNKQRVFVFRGVKNFKVSNVHIEDVKVQLPIMSFGPTESGELVGPTNGEISYASVNNCHYGYGLVQMQCAFNTKFHKLSGVGGVTLRAETGAAAMNDAQRGGVFGVTGEYIHCKNGNAVVMVSPHSMINGDVSFDHINSDGCGWAVRLDKGFISSKQTTKGLKVGTYTKATVDNVKAIAGKNAQVKTKHFGFYKEGIAKQCPAYDENLISEPTFSVGAVLNEANFPVEIGKVEVDGFDKAILTPKDELTTEYKKLKKQVRPTPKDAKLAKVKK